MYIPFTTFRSYCSRKIKALGKQGYMVQGLQEKLDSLPDSYDALIAFAKALSTELSMDPAFPYTEPNTLDEIRALRPAACQDFIPTYQSELEIKDRIYGGVLGRMIGCALGKPLEINWDQARIKQYLEGANAWPLNDFIPPHSKTQPHPLRRDCVDSMKGFVNCMQEDDDINYLVLGLKVLENYGFDFTTHDMAHLWLENLPYRWTWGPEHLVYMSLANHWLDTSNPLPTGSDWDSFTGFLNCMDEAIGAMIRGDSFGLVNPGQPGLAADMAWRDGRLTHTKTGLYAEMWAAATIAAAINEPDPQKAIQAGIDQLPANSRYVECLGEALEWSMQESDWQKVYSRIDKKWGHLGHGGTLNESAAIINSLIHSYDSAVGIIDFEKAICITVMHGWDTDCSGATAGCIAGVLCGYNNIPAKWSSRLNDTFYTCVATERETSISRFAERMYQMSRIVRACMKVRQGD